MVNQLISNQQYTLPNDTQTTKGNFYFGIIEYGLKKLVSYHDEFLQLQKPTFPPWRGELNLDEAMKQARPPILPNGLNSIGDLNPTDAAWTLHLMIGRSEDYRRTVSMLRPYAEKNPVIGILLEVTEERVNALLDIAKKAPLEVLKAAQLEDILEAVH
ncbi:hypothetical protein HYS31_03420 [Candidatus Woesearchaeota archaeon]|nr:hypothetical protein [Candidatus Woesearchaeota archaeon]